MSLLRDRPISYLITSGDATPENLNESGRDRLDIIRFAVAANISLVQIREKNLSARLLFEFTREASALTANTQTRLLVNDRADVALAGGANGIHLTSKSLAVDVVRSNFPVSFIIGVSAHTIDEVVSAANLGADFAVFGPVFDTPGKGPAIGLKRLASVCRTVSRFPVVAVGGIDDSNFESALNAGAAGIASIRWLNRKSTLEAINGMIARYGYGV